MNHCSDVMLRKEVFEKIGVSEVAFDKLDLVINYGRAVAVDEIVQYDDVVPLGDHHAHGVGTDVTGATHYEYLSFVFCHNRFLSISGLCFIRYGASVVNGLAFWGSITRTSGWVGRTALRLHLSAARLALIPTWRSKRRYMCQYGSFYGRSIAFKFGIYNP